MYDYNRHMLFYKSVIFIAKYRKIQSSLNNVILNQNSRKLNSKLAKMSQKLKIKTQLGDFRV